MESGEGEKERVTCQCVAFVVCQVYGEAGGDCLFEDGEVAGAGGVEEAGGEVDGFGREGGFGGVGCGGAGLVLCGRGWRGGRGGMVHAEGHCSCVVVWFGGRLPGGTIGFWLRDGTEEANR